MSPEQLTEPHPDYERPKRTGGKPPQAHGRTFRIALGRDPETAEEAIEVYCDEGVVYLRGSVRRAAAADRAASIAASIDGARKVVDRITRPSANG